MLALDLPWVLTNVSRGLYRGLVNGAVTGRPAVAGLWLGVLAVNAVLLGLLGASASTWPAALLTGAIAGLAVYGTFNATSLVMFKPWPRNVAAADTAWGMVLLGGGAVAAYLAADAVRQEHSD